MPRMRAKTINVSNGLYFVLSQTDCYYALQYFNQIHKWDINGLAQHHIFNRTK